MGSFACGAEWLARSTALGYRVHDRVLEMLEHWGEGRALDLFAPSAAGRDQARRFGTFERGGSPAAVAAGGRPALVWTCTPARRSAGPDARVAQAR
jgi:hypothetical protein